MTSKPDNPRVFFDFSIRDNQPKRVIFELFKNHVPITVENFRALCTGEKGYSTISPDKLLSYKGSIIHRIVPNFMIQGGDFIQQNGKSGESIYGGEFDDENFDLNCDREGLLVMANKGPDTNQSQWFITLAPAEHLSGKHVVFGRVQSGFEVVQEIGTLETDKKHRPLGGIDVVQIVHCGQLERKQKINTVDKIGDDSQELRFPLKLLFGIQRLISFFLMSLSIQIVLILSSVIENAILAQQVYPPRLIPDVPLHLRGARVAQKNHRPRLDEGGNKKGRTKRNLSSKSKKKLKFKEQQQKQQHDGDEEGHNPRAQEELALMKVELEHQQAERQRQIEQENLRLEQDKVRKARALELLKNQSHRKEGGVIFKGRGSMRYRDGDASFGTRSWKD
ncbi:hypothetical protein PSHT_09188 [Puccinia striiformis]|uniref:peptidylprolyl isomerase n=1 Tax=Puccinia striiformis TaxID=27350 RepID=A0A2S4VIA0_9BASI|nr:hypothetical protein PSHT_09188 [Puccinia striiformis]